VMLALDPISPVTAWVYLVFLAIPKNTSTI
jgi:hypothetical protein